MLNVDSSSVSGESDKNMKTTDSVTEKDVKEFQIREKLALSMIYLNVEPDFHRIIENCTDPVTAWCNLRTHFYPDTRSHHMQTFRELCECKMTSDENINLYAARLLRVAHQLKNINKKFDDVYITFQLLRFLTFKFDSIVQTILRWKDEEFILKDMVTSLVTEETRIQLRECDHRKVYPEAQTLQYQRKPKMRIIATFEKSRVMSTVSVAFS